MVDEATEQAPVESPPMMPYEHAQTSRAHERVFERIAETLKSLREQVGPEPRDLKSRVIIDSTPEGSKYQVYFPELGVAGEGRCTCEASLEAVHALEVILESALEHKDWSILPAPDRSVKARIAALKTSVFVQLMQYLDKRLSAEDVRNCKRVTSDLALAVA